MGGNDAEVSERNDPGGVLALRNFARPNPCNMFLGYRNLDWLPVFDGARLRLVDVWQRNFVPNTTRRMSDSTDMAHSYRSRWVSVTIKENKAPLVIEGLDVDVETLFL
jgi:hypothetical protein